jgi:hypothetical protein
MYVDAALNHYNASNMPTAYYNIDKNPCTIYSITATNGAYNKVMFSYQSDSPNSREYITAK